MFRLLKRKYASLCTVMIKKITENAYFPNEPIEALKFGFRKAE